MPTPFSLHQLSKSIQVSNHALILLFGISSLSYAETATQLPTTVVTASALDAEAQDMATATSIVFSEDIHEQPSSTLGSVLANEMGVNADSFGQGSSRPIIRGQTAPRVSILQNGIAVHDASHISPDHQVSVPVVNAEKIEVIKGSSALLYGGGAIGGLVNVVDNSPHEKLNKSFQGKVGLVTQQATHGYMAHVQVQGQITDNLRVKANMQISDHGNMYIPHWDENNIKSTWYQQNNIGVSATYTDNKDYITTKYQHIGSEYGLPAHVHNDCMLNAANNSLECGHAGHHHHHEHGEPPFVDLSSHNFQLLAQKEIANNILDNVKVKASLTDYQHDEMDEGSLGTTFKNKAFSGSLHARRKTHTTENIKSNGVFGFDYHDNDFSAKGTEDYLPKTNTKKVGVFFVERLEPVSSSNKKSSSYIQLGARQDFQKAKDTDNNISHRFTAFSTSIEAGVPVSHNSSISARVNHSQRMPSAQELFAYGTHVATNTWERGNSNLKTEKTTGIETNFKHQNDDVSLQVSAYYNSTDDYIYAKTQDLVKTGESAGFRLIDYSQTDAQHYGGEVKLDYYLNDDITLTGFGDYSITQLYTDNNSKKYAPRMVAPRLGGEVNADLENFTVSLLGYHRFTQNNITEFETITPSYNMVNAKVSYTSESHHDITAMLQVNNILNELAQNHASYLAEQVPLMGRSVNVGVNYQF